MRKALDFGVVQFGSLVGSMRVQKRSFSTLRSALPCPSLYGVRGRRAAKTDSWLNPAGLAPTRAQLPMAEWPPDVA